LAPLARSDYHRCKNRGNNQSALIFNAKAPAAAGTRGTKIGSECALYVMAKLRKWLQKRAFARFLSRLKP
jgi:hypothetical protein